MRWLDGSKPSYDKLAKVAQFYNQPIEIFSITNNDGSEYTKGDIPIVGRIQAGYPVEAFENAEGYVSLPTGMKYSADLFALRVAGDSMLPLVMDGDVIILNRNVEQVNGKICAVTVDGESTLKRVKKDSTGVTLIPTNPMYPELHYSPKKAKELGFHVDGVLVQMIRNF